MCAGPPGPTANNRAQMKQIDICIGPVSNGLLLARHLTPQTQNSQKKLRRRILRVSSKIVAIPQR